MVKQKASASHVVRDKKGNVKLSLEPEDTRSYQHGIGELLNCVDNLIASETMPTLSSTRKWWNGLSSNAKRDELRVMSSTVSSDTDCFDGTPKQFDAYCSEQKQDIMYYMDASATKSKNQFHTPYKLPDGRWVGSW